MRIQHFIALVVLSLLTVPGAPAATTTWTGADPSGNWSAPANWSPAGVPVNGDALVFPGGLPLADMVSTNDLADSIFRSITFSGASRHTIRGNPITLTNRTDCIINSGTNVLACDVTFSGTPPTPTYTTIRSSSFDSGELTVIGNVGGGSLHVGNGRWRLVIMGQFTGGSLFVDWYSTLALYGDNPYAVSAFVSGSTLLVEGSQPNLNVAMYYNIEDVTPASLSGNGLIGDVTWVAGGSRITPDSTLSVKNVSAFSPIFRLNGTNVGEYGRLVASGSVNLGRGSLLPSPGFNPQAGQVYTIVEKTSPGPITNAFYGTSEFLGPEGTVANLNGMPLRISYVGGDGNDVTLTVGTNARPTVTITNPPNAAVFSAPASFSLAASASDPDGSVTNVQFFRDATSLGNDSSSPYSASVSGLAAGNYTLSAVASDNRGLRATNSIVVTVAGPPAATNIWTGADPSGYWSAPANWSPAGVPVNGNDLVFPGGLPTADMVSTNDLPNSFFRSITFNQGSRHTIRGNPMTLTNSSALIASRGTNEIACDLILTATPLPSAPYYQWPRFNILYPGELTVSGNIAGSYLYPAGGRFVLRGQFPGGRVYAYGGTQAFYGDHAHALTVTNVGGTLFVRGSQPNLNLAMHWEMESADCPDLTAEGVVGDITGCGHIILDSTLSVKSLGGRGASQASWRVLDIRLNGTNVGEYGKLISSGDVTLTGASLTPTLGFNPQPGQVFTIVDKTSPGPITTVPGYDTNLFGPEGKIINLNGMPFRLSYVGGDGNDVTLTAQPTNVPTTTNTWTGADPSGNWSAPANWSPAGAPENGNDLVFPGGLPPGDMVSTNDLPESFFRSITFGGASRHTIRGNPITLTNRAECITNRGTNVIATDLNFSGTPSSQFPSIRGLVGPTGILSELTVIGNVGGGGLHVGVERLVIRGQFTGGSLRVLVGSLALYGDNPHAVSAELTGSTLFVQGSQPNLYITLRLEMETFKHSGLTGDGLVGDVSGFGTIAPDSTLSVKNMSGVALSIRLTGTNVGEYGKLVATGDVSPSSGFLIPSAGFGPQAGQIYTIVEKTSQGPISNAFLGPEGTITFLNGMPFRISYVGGDGNDLTLTAAPPRLNVTRMSNPAQVRLSWPTNYPGFLLQRASPLDGSAPWLFQNAPLSPVVIGGDYTVTTPAATNQELFRLRRE